MRVDSRAEAADEGLVNFSDYLRVLRRRKVLVALGLVLGVIAGFGYFHSQPKSYTSTASVQVKPIATNVQGGSSASSNTINISTETQVARSTAIAQRVVTTLRVNQPPTKLIRRLTVTVPGKSNVLQFTYTGSSVSSAQQITQAFANSYLTLRKEQATALVKGLAQDLQTRIAALQSQLLVVQTTLSTSTQGTSAYSNAVAMQKQLTAQLVPLRTRLDSLNTLVLDPGTVIVPAGAGRPTGLALKLLLIAGGLIGLVIGILLAFLRDLTDNRIRETSDVERAAGSPAVATLPDPYSAGRGLVVLDDTLPDRQDSYGGLAARLLVAARRENLRAIVVTAPERPRESLGVAANLAVAIAQSDTPVSFVAADDGSLPDLTGIPKLRSVPLRSLTGGARLADPDRTRTLLAGLEEGTGVTIIASGPVLSAADSLVLASVADGVLLVVTRLVSRRKGIEAALDRLDQFDARLLGVALVAGGRLSRRLTRTRARDVPAQMVERETASLLH